MLLALYWFHAFASPKYLTAQHVFDVLRKGPKAWPGGTRVNEGRLGIKPPRFYAFAGRTHSDFGKAAFVEPLTERLGDGGEVSPFDTGGLVNHFQPVSGWEDEEKQSFVIAFTWPAKEIHRLLKEYPTHDRSLVKAYISRAVPKPREPKECWTQGVDAADFWRSDENEWRAWTWELRTTNFAPPNEASIVAWTCPDHIYQKFMEMGEKATGPELDWFETVAKVFTTGGVANLVEEYKTLQSLP